MNQNTVKKEKEKPEKDELSIKDYIYNPKTLGIGSLFLLLIGNLTGALGWDLCTVGLNKTPYIGEGVCKIISKANSDLEKKHKNDIKDLQEKHSEEIKNIEVSHSKKIDTLSQEYEKNKIEIEEKVEIFRQKWKDEEAKAIQLRKELDKAGLEDSESRRLRDHRKNLVIFYSNKSQSTASIKNSEKELRENHYFTNFKGVDTFSSEEVNTLSYGLSVSHEDVQTIARVLIKNKVNIQAIDPIKRRVNEFGQDLRFDIQIHRENIKDSCKIWTATAVEESSDFSQSNEYCSIQK